MRRTLLQHTTYWQSDDAQRHHRENHQAISEPIITVSPPAHSLSLCCYCALNNMATFSFTHLLQTRRSSHQFIGTPECRCGICRTTTQTGLRWNLLDEIGAKVPVRQTRLFAHQLKSAQDEIGRIGRHAGHIARKDIVVVVFVVECRQFERIPKSNGLKETGQVVKSVGTFANNAQK